MVALDFGHGGAMPTAYVITQPMQKASQPSAAPQTFLYVLFACVAGGSAGIGKATALAFDKNGCKVAVLGRRKERLDAVVSLKMPRFYPTMVGWTLVCAWVPKFGILPVYCLTLLHECTLQLV